MFVETIIAFIVGLLMLEALLLPLNGVIKTIHKIRPNNQPALECKKVSENKNWQIEKCTIGKETEILKLSGFTLYEFLISTLISLTVITVSLNSLGTVSFQAKKAEVKLAEISLALRISSEVERIFRFSEQTPLKFPPIIHPAGQIRLADSSLNIVHYGNIKLQPAPESMVLSNISLDFIQGLKIENCSVSGKKYQGKACLKTSDSLQSHKSYLLYSLDGYQEAAGTFSGNGKCRDFSLEATDGIYFRSINNLKSCNLIYLIPIKAIQSLYISKQGDLRLITHRGQDNPENQPLTRTFPDIKLTLKHEAGSLNWELYSRSEIIKSGIIPEIFLANKEMSFFMNIL